MRSAIGLGLCLTMSMVAIAHEQARQVVFLERSAIAADSSVLPRDGFVATGQPDVAVLQAAADAGFAAVVDLRTADEERGIDERAEVEALGMSYVSLPVAGPAGVTFENARELDRILAGFDGAVLLHCGSGNRAGALFALRAKLAGAGDEEALAVGRAAGLGRLEPAVRERLGEAEQR